MTPKTETELAQMIAGANGPLRIKGGGTRAIGHCEGDALNTSAMSGISLYEPGALTIVAGAGTPLAEVEKVLAAENQRIAFEPMDHRALLGTKGEPTLGGMAAANVSGPRRISVGACRDFMLGVRFVDGAGNIIKNGGRVMKNVTGYDLVKLMTGSYGTLGVLTEVSLKVLPNVDCVGTLRLHGLTDAQAIQALSAALGSPFEATGAAHFPKGPAGDPVTMLRIEGFEDSVNYRAGKLTSLLKPYGDAEMTVDDGAAWTDVRDVTTFADQPGNVWRISTKPSDAAELVSRIDAKAVQYDWGGGLIWALTDEGRDLRSALGTFDGHATLIRGTADVPTFHPEVPALAAITTGLRAKFDPRGILNSGIMS
ncbi:glycolate oxidase FAD binding subunit [Yoonia maricola]|uniref:Glycolate oxidase FAD binding subunit n=1 Tax=Yoonia maricola TaxID=420999 RepID=A0A2M8W2Q9_9RHOB|nr:FAD-binding protein [Yoonia maricola]PJI85216.1 glycolate oxidase FAD binding subunit [Yoonia maricola]